VSQSTPTVYTTRPWRGNEVIPAIRSALEAWNTTNKGAAAPSYKEEGTLWIDDTGHPTWTLKLYDGTQWADIGTIDSTTGAFNATGVAPTSAAFDNADTTPSVAGRKSLYTTDSNGTITTFDDGVAGQIVRVLAADAATTIHSDLTASGKTLPLVAGDVMEWVYTGAAWKQVSGTVGMGNRYVPLSVPDAIGDWIGADIDAYTDVDVSDDGVRKGAVAVHCTYYMVKAGGTYGLLKVRENGSTATGIGTYAPWCTPVANDGVIGTFTVGVDSGAVFEAAFNIAWDASTINQAHVLGYWI
jgi:hypothetical protein